ncbi:leucyl aminopeptidase family protein [Crenalkalicoccus roseus]|uniref:leucyl aminopeptidase family protein n=1 Tax=Crenalkalicoccus roseus TaxID=1485588 RepID=UPI0010801B9A|nr:leucyl aminopeptidase family protein [Crenalkalicoccus roseus]
MLTCLAGADAPALPLHVTDPSGLEALLGRLGPGQAAWLRATGFAARAQEVALLPGAEGLAGAVLGLGAEATTPWSFGGLPLALPPGTAWRLAEPGPWAAAAVLGWCLGAYRYARFKPAPRAPALLAPPAGVEEALVAAEATWRVRDLINTPANLLGPAELAEAVRDLAAAHGAACAVIAGEALRDGFPALHAVGAGSPRAPRVAVLEWGEAGAPLVALCGKGVCFDTGGLDLKPSAAMLRMKKDMGGAAVVLGLAEMVMRLRLPVRLLVLVGAVENAVSGEAFRPMDVLRTRAGLAVEVGNTDAEGRLVLCDLLAFAAERRPALLLDCATLTGAARVALGPDLPALFTPDDALAEALLGAARETEDPMWRLPLHGGYASWLDSAIADLGNVSSRPMAGAIIGALFLQRFVPAGLRWAHLDLYAWNDTSRPGRPEGGEAQAMRALVAGIRRLFGSGPGAGR